MNRLKEGVTSCLGLPESMVYWDHTFLHTRPSTGRSERHSSLGKRQSCWASSAVPDSLQLVKEQRLISLHLSRGFLPHARSWVLPCPSSKAVLHSGSRDIAKAEPLPGKPLSSSPQTTTNSLKP